jgi:hypothetical protein
MLDVRRGLVVVACVSVGFIISARSGLVARAAEPDRWASLLAADANATAARASAAQSRIAELEQRVKELEGRQNGAPGAGELTAVITRNKELAARNLALTLEQHELARRVSEAASNATCEPPADADPREQLRYWAKQIKDGETSFSRFSPDVNAALNVLLRRERQLDPHNPWRTEP